MAQLYHFDILVDFGTGMERLALIHGSLAFIDIWDMGFEIFGLRQLGSHGWWEPAYKKRPRERVTCIIWR